MTKKPVLFLDFDRTLFDIDRFFGEFLGYRHEEHIAKVREFLASNPTLDISGFFYDDTIPFLEAARESHTLVLLSRGRSFPEFQRKKILGSRVAEWLDDVIVTPSDDKGAFASPFLPHGEADGAFDRYTFIDDNLEALRSMEIAAPLVRRIYIDRRKRRTEKPDGAHAITHDLHLGLLE